MALPTDVLGQFASNAETIFAGQTSDVWILPGGLNPQPPSFYPVHGLSLNGIPAKPAVVVTKNLRNGVTAVAAVAYVKTITVTTFGNLVADTSTLTVGTKTYLFKASGAAGDQINIGASNDATATNIRTKINTDLVTGELQSATVLTNVVTLTGLATGVTFPLSTNAPTALTLATTVTGNAAVTGVKASATVRPKGTRHKAGTISQITLIMVVGDTGPQRIRFQFDTPSDSTTNAEIALGLQAILVAGIDDTTESAPVDGSRMISSNLDNTTEEIAAAMVNLFATNASFSVVSDVLTIEAGSTGADGNNIGIEVITLPSLPGSIIEIAEDGTPQTDGICRHLGTQDAFQVVVTPQTIDINASNFPNRFTRITTGQTIDINFKLFQDNDVEFIEAGTSRAATSYDNTKNVLLFGGTPLPAKFAIIFTSPSKIIGGSFDVLVIYNCEASSTTINRAKAQANGLDFKLSPNALNRQGDSVGYLAQVRSL